MYSLDHFGKKASFDEQQAVVVEALVKDYLRVVKQWVFSEIEREEMEEKLKTKELELQELQKFIDASISSLDPDRR